MDDSISALATSDVRVLAPVCPACEERTNSHREHVIRGDVVTITWVCPCDSRWPADAI